MNALKRAGRAAAKAGVELSEWEGGFLTDVAERVAVHGRAFADPEKGSPGQALSALQARKLREIAAKARGEAPPTPRWARRSRPPGATDGDEEAG